MLRLIRNRKAQNTMEYALIIAVVIGALTAMQLYTKRGIQARLKGGVDKAPDVVMEQEPALQGKNVLGTETQYEPYYYTKGQYEMATTGSEGAEKGAVSESSGVRELEGATTQRTGKQEITGTDEED